MPNTLKDNQSNVICGLGSFTHTAANTGMYTMFVRTDENPPSGLTLTFSQSGSQSASASSTAPTAAQAAIQFRHVFNVVAGDILTFAATSSTPIDEQTNTVKSTVTVKYGQGQ